MLLHRRLLILLLATAAIWTGSRQTASTQSSLRRLTVSPEAALNLNPSLSGDGRIVAFESTADLAATGGGDSFRALRANVAADPAAFNQVGLTRAPAPGISQDGSRITFASTDNPLGTNDDGNSEIFLADGARLAQITNTLPGDGANRIVNGNFQPSLSDDGRFLAFSSNRDLANQNSDSNREIFVYDTLAGTFAQATNSTGILGFGAAKISGDGNTLVYLRDDGQTTGGNLSLVRQNRQTLVVNGLLARDVPGLALTYGRAVSDDGLRVVWSAQTATNTTQVFLYDGRNNQTRQITTLGSRAADVGLLPTISGDGSRIAFATRRNFLGNSDGGVDLYTFDIPSATFARVTSGPAGATAEVVSSLNDDGSLVAFSFPRVLSGAATREVYENNSEIYLAATPARPSSGSLTTLNRASSGQEPSATKALAPDSIAMALGNALALTTIQSERQPDGTFPTTAGGTTVTVNGQAAQIFFVSPTEVHFHVPIATALGTAEVVVTNSDGFPSRGIVTVLDAAPGVFTASGAGLGEGLILNADTLQAGPFDPTSGSLRLIVFATGLRNGSPIAIAAGGRTLTMESLINSDQMPGLDEVHLLVPADLRGAGPVELVVRAGGRDSNPAIVQFSGDAARDLLINEFLADPPGATPTDVIGDANHDGTRDVSADEFVELVNTTPHDLDLSGYRLLTRGGSGSADTLRHVFPSGTIARACSAIVIFGGANNSFDPSHPAFGGALTAKASTGSLALLNSAGVITLQDQSATIVNLLSYGGATGLDADNNQSLTRAPDLKGKFRPHLAASGGASVFSPGAQLTGAPFSPCTPAIVRVEVSPSQSSVTLGGSQQFTARAFDAGNHEVPGVIFSWQTSNTTVATIDLNGLATGAGVGTTEIRAIGRGLVSAPANLTVTPPPPVLTSVTISPATATIGLGETAQFTAQAKDQFGQDIGGVDISFASSDLAIATVSFGSASVTGFATATAFPRFNGTTEIQATASDGPTSVISFPAVLTVEPGAHELLISEFRTRGPGGAADEFVEIYNPTSSILRLGGLKLRASNGTGTVSDRLTIPGNTTLGPGCHYLLANTAFTGGVLPDQTYATGITDDGGLAITGASGTRIIDSVGLSATSAYKEGNPLAPLAGTVDRGYERKPGGQFGNGTDTDQNSSDFSLTAPSNPQNSTTGCLDTGMADLAISQTDAPDPVTIGGNLSYTLTVSNNGVAFAQQIIVRDELPAGVSFVACTATGGGTCAGEGNNRRVNFATLASGAAATITFIVSVTAPAGTIISNTATVESVLPDTNRTNNLATNTTLVQAVLPGLGINDVTASEGNGGATTFSFNVSLSAPAPAGGVTFDLATQDNSATAAAGDYLAQSLTEQTISSGNTTYSFDVTVKGDMLVEGNEAFFVNVTNVRNASLTDGQGQATILNDDAPLLVISQVYGGGGNASATYANDFIEIFNRGATTVDFAVTPYSVQYAAATANFSTNKTDLTSGLLLPGHHFLIREASGGGNGAVLPSPDATGSINLAATAGKVALVVGTTALNGSACQLGSTIADFLGYGSTANCFESAPLPVSGTNANARSVIRTAPCADANNNSTDFSNPATAPVARNTTNAATICP